MEHTEKENKDAGAPSGLNDELGVLPMRELVELGRDARRYRWLLGYYLDNGEMPRYPVFGLKDDMHTVDEKIDRYITGDAIAWNGKFGGYTTN